MLSEGVVSLLGEMLTLQEYRVVVIQALPVAQFRSPLTSYSVRLQLPLLHFNVSAIPWVVHCCDNSMPFSFSFSKHVRAYYVPATMTSNGNTQINI